MVSHKLAKRSNTKLLQPTFHSNLNLILHGKLTSPLVSGDGASMIKIFVKLRMLVQELVAFYLAITG